MIITIKEFQKRMFFYFNNLPVSITRKGVVVATIHPPDQEVVTSKNNDKKVVTKEQVIENKEEVEVVTKVVTCEKCKLECEQEEIRAHWEDGEEHRVCLYCLKKKKREPKKTSLVGVKMNDKMKEFLKEKLL